jgi:hypothetical protein
MNKKPNNAIRISTSINGSFFKFWFKFLEPFHHLTEREMDVIASFVRHRYELSKVIKDNKILDKVVMSKDTQKKIQDDCGLSVPHFQVILGKLRKRKVILDDVINPRFIPNIQESDTSCNLLLIFDLNNEK